MRLRPVLRRGGAGDVVSARPRARLQPFRPVRPAGLVLVGREPRVAFDLPADRRGVAAEHQNDPPDDGAVADLDPDDLAFLFRQVRTCFFFPPPIGATSLRTGYPDNLQSNGCCTFK